MIGAIIGDVVGSRFEFHNLKSKDFEFFHPDCKITDDSVLTIAVADAIMQCHAGKGSLSELAACRLHIYGRRYPKAGYGASFMTWLFRMNLKPYNSYGNGAAMRVSPAGFLGTSLEECLSLAEAVTAVTHNHPEGIKGAQATVSAIWLGRQGASMEEIRDYISEHYYTLDFTLDEIRPTYTYDVTCQGTVPQAIEAVLESTSFEDAIRNAISIGGDSDTVGAIAGGIAEACYGVPAELVDAVREYIPNELWTVVDEYQQLMGNSNV